MSESVMQHSFNSGEWAPALNARVDIQKYHNGAALLRNFFVDYRGGATARAGTKFVAQTRFTNKATRLIGFQASFTVSYILEFGDGYVRFHNNGAPVLETAVTGGTNAAVNVFTIANTFAIGDWVLAENWGGKTNVNGNYYIISAAAAGAVTVTDLRGNAVVFTGVYTAGGQLSRVYTLASPFTAAELYLIKFAQYGIIMVLTHPNYPLYGIEIITGNSWFIGPFGIGADIVPPTGVGVATTLAAGTVRYAYVVTSVNSTGQESVPSAYGTLGPVTDIRLVAGTNTVSWTIATGAQSYNVYRAQPSYAGAVPTGAAFGFVGNVTGLSFIDSNIAPDYGLGPPIDLNPFFGFSIETITVTAAGAYAGGAAVPTISLAGVGTDATASPNFQTTNIVLTTAGTGYAVGDLIRLSGDVMLKVLTIGVNGAIATFQIVNVGLISIGTFPTTPTSPSSSSGTGIGSTWTLTWGLASVTITNPGVGYIIAPPVVFSSGAAAATAFNGCDTPGNPTVPAFFQQRLVLAGPVGSPQQMNMSQTGAYTNFNINSPIEADNAITATIVSNQLSTIQSMIAQPYGLIVLSDKGAWLVNGGSNGAPVTPSNISANAQIYNGASYQPPIVAGDNILYVQAKGSIVRNLVFNYYTQVYTGTDISILSSHLFYGYKILEWAWAEEPFKIIWAVRNDGVLLSLTFLKEQELLAWAHSDTTGGLFKSIATITETVSVGPADAIYTVVQRQVGGIQVQYIERMAELFYPTGLTDAWCVDAGLQYNGTSALTFTGAQHLAGVTVTGLATDNLGNVTVITPFAMATTGSFTLPAPTSPATGYTRVTVGIAYVPQLQTLAIDLTAGETVQGRRKKISAVTARVKDALGLSIGGTFSSLVAMKDLVVGNVGFAANARVTGLVTTDARTVVEPNWTVPGQYCFQQNNPYPCSILGVIPEITVGDTAK